MVKENHKQKTVIMPTALEDRLIDYVLERRKAERKVGIPHSQRTTESLFICEALDYYLQNTKAIEKKVLKHYRSA